MDSYWGNLVRLRIPTTSILGAFSMKCAPCMSSLFCHPSIFFLFAPSTWWVVVFLSLWRITLIGLHFHSIQILGPLVATISSLFLAYSPLGTEYFSLTPTHNSEGEVVRLYSDKGFVSSWQAPKSPVFFDSLHPAALCGPSPFSCLF